MHFYFLLLFPAYSEEHKDWIYNMILSLDIIKTNTH